MALVAYIIAYLGFFIAEALTHFVWVILFIVSPLMILAYIPKSTANATTNLYKGLVKVVIWKILWTILGALLLTMAMNPQTETMEDYLLSIVMNLCIGLSMLFIPIATRSLINDGLESAASALAMAPAMAAAKATTIYAKTMGKKGPQKTWNGGRFLAKPLTNPIMGRMDRLKKTVSPQMNSMKKQYSNLNMPKPKPYRRAPDNVISLSDYRNKGENKDNE